MKHRVLILGAGMVVQPLIDYLLERNIEITLASRTLSKAQKALKDHPQGKAVSWTIDQVDQLNIMVMEHDLVVSLLPYTHHVTVAKVCINHKTNMLTTSYISEQMKDLDQDAKEAGIIILNEIGVDPGFDHMTAMRIIDRVHAEGGKIKAFYSLCGALAAPEALDNPLKYKFSWSPKGVVMAGNNDAQYLENGKEIHKLTEDLFKKPLQIDFPEIGPMEVYPNRNSLPYIDIYGIPEVQTIYRGTFRYKNWCEALDIMKNIGLTSYNEYDLKGKSYAEFTAQIAGLESSKGLENALAISNNISTDSPAIQTMEFLGLFSDKQVHLEQGSPFDVLSDLMIEKMMLGDKERDMVIMQHIFTIIKPDSSEEKLTASLLDFGDQTYTSIAKTVAYPAAIGVKMILDGKIDVVGVHIPTKKEIYEPILDELEKLGIIMHEHTDL